MLWETFRHSSPPDELDWLQVPKGPQPLGPQQTAGPGEGTTCALAASVPTRDWSGDRCRPNYAKLTARPAVVVFALAVGGRVAA